MPETMSIEDYLAEGGILTSPANVPSRYRGELLRLMASFVDSELAGSAGFADAINDAPGIKARIAAARIVLEKADHAERVLKVMETFGVDTARYATHRPWDTRVEREADIAAARQGGDMRLSVFHYPLQGWVDAVVMNVLMGIATVVQLEELSHVSYGPLAETFREIAQRETRHAELGYEGLARIAESEEGRAKARKAIAYWRPRVAATFGQAGSLRYQVLKRFGLRHTPNEILMTKWATLTDDRLGDLQLD
ncbi:Phenylacetic acid catabolic protein [Consotaella salsifontis]|uniref:1,2-phenylacetyl-CoA epoxidase, catalytic subunit n=1 Tax=Consotaella salsifontis TaxID=1365950 RepID=A0A1T4PMB8_9HYPH|nr:Phenylacetic acid catabolic protein [Consotaella salsifontis]SJZ92705.1 1,2-phenylacetyl-CoA epoxidase, catalytic subunit [Consotaella salsifontis]